MAQEQSIMEQDPVFALLTQIHRDIQALREENDARKFRGSGSRAYQDAAPGRAPERDRSAVGFPGTAMAGRW